MNLIDLAIRRPVFAWVLMFTFIVFGAVALNRLGISQMPDVDFPVLSITVNYEGASPEVVESEILDDIETHLLSIEGIKEMRSVASEGSGRVTLEFDINRNVDVVLQEVQAALSEIKFPPGIDPPTIRKRNPEEDPIIYMSIFGGKNAREMINWVDSYFLDQLRFLPGVGDVSIAGFSERNLRIWINPRELDRYDLTIGDLIDALKTQHVETAAGQFSDEKRELRVRWLGEATNPAQVGEIRILRRGGQVIHNRVIRVKDVATIEDGLSDVRRIARVDGKEAVNISIHKQRGTNEVTVAKAITAKLKQLKESFPPGYDYRVNVDFTRSTESTVHLTVEKLWVAGLITILVCFLFLGSIPAAINILFSIPTSILGTFIILYFSGFTLNLFTLLALTLAISIVVDDAIMLLENIIRHYRMGKTSTQAASDGAKEILPAAIAATFAVIAVFLPVIFMSGIIGKFFFQFGVTMSAAVLISLVEAVTITPMRAAALLRTESQPTRLENYLDRRFERLAHIYRAFLEKTLRWKMLVVFGSLTLFALSLLLVRQVRQEFVPPQDQDLILVSGTTPPGSSLEFTEQVSKKMEEIAKNEKYVTGFFVSVGAGGSSSDVNSIFMPLTLTPKSERPVSYTEIMNHLRKEFRQIKDVRVTMRDTSTRNLTAGRRNPLAINLRGPDLSVLSEKAQDLMKQLEDERLAVDLDTDYRTGIPELEVVPKRDAMAERGVSVEDVGQVLAASVGGLRQGRYTADGRRYDIRFKFGDEFIHSPQDIDHINVRNIVGNLVPLSQIVDINERPASQSITRINRQRAVAVFGNLAPGTSQAKVLERTAQIAKSILPVGYMYAFEGAAAGLSEAFGSLFVALMLGILVAYLILAVQFNSFIHPITVLIALPFSVTGALIALWLTGSSLNLFSFIGLIVLMGIAKKNSILLVEFTNHVRQKNPEAPITAALLEASPVRLRPILMTSVATVVAALPLVFGNSMGQEARSPMGLAIIGGTLISTLLTLFVVPSFYLLLSRFENKKRPHV